MNALEERFGGRAFLFASGREALLALFQGDPERFRKGDEVIVQGYTCVVVPNAVQAAGLVPMYADIEKATLSLDPQAVERAITPRTKAVLCQHTFGIPAPVAALREICDRHNLLLIEDCAHILPDDRGPEDVGSRGDALLLSFGRDKAISGITGGAIVVRTRPAASLLRDYEQQTTSLPRNVILRLLLYPLLYTLARPLYGIGAGKLMLAAARSLRLLLPIVTGEEKHGKQGMVLHAMPEPCAALALQQWRNLRAINDHRRMLTGTYLQACAAHGWGVLHGIRSDLPLQKFPLFMKDAKKIRRELKQRNIHLNDGWTGCVVCPADVRVDEVGYRKGTDPRAEEACEEILTLPTHTGMRMKDAERLIRALHPFLQEHRLDGLE
jgi:dTDP-4-amino-4,6-dideoxygalactose transaminase